MFDKSDELIQSGAKSLVSLIPKISKEDFGSPMLTKILELFLHVKNPRIRQSLSDGIK
jgi:hypothetical protein